MAYDDYNGYSRSKHDLSDNYQEDSGEVACYTKKILNYKLPMIIYIYIFLL